MKITINVTVIYMARYVMVLRRARSTTRGIGRGGPWKSRLLWDLKWLRAKRVPFGLKKVDKKDYTKDRKKRPYSYYEDKKELYLEKKKRPYYYHEDKKELYSGEKKEPLLLQYYEDKKEHYLGQKKRPYSF
jgi:hypothetical protein